MVERSRRMEGCWWVFVVVVIVAGRADSQAYGKDRPEENSGQPFAAGGMKRSSYCYMMRIIIVVSV